MSIFKFFCKPKLSVLQQQQQFDENPPGGRVEYRPSARIFIPESSDSPVVAQTYPFKLEGYTLDEFQVNFEVAGAFMGMVNPHATYMDMNFFKIVGTYEEVTEALDFLEQRGAVFESLPYNQRAIAQGRVDEHNSKFQWWADAGHPLIKASLIKQ